MVHVYCTASVCNVEWHLAEDVEPNKDDFITILESVVSHNPFPLSVHWDEEESI